MYKQDLTLLEAVTLIGAHSIGHVHVKHSGFGISTTSNPHDASALLVNAWDSTPHLLDNKYFQNMIDNPWLDVFTTNQQLPQWVTKDTLNIMLNTDMTLHYPISQLQPQHGQECETVDGNPRCFGPDSDGVPISSQIVQMYANNNTLFLENFYSAFLRMTSVGYRSSTDTPSDSSGGGKLGTLRRITLPK